MQIQGFPCQACQQNVYRKNITVDTDQIPSERLSCVHKRNQAATLNTTKKMMAYCKFLPENASNNEKKTDIPQISYSVKAKTYRYVGATAATDVENTTKADAGGAK